VVVQQAADSVVVFASDEPALASALAPSERYQALDLGLGEPPLSVVFVDGAHARLNAALDTDQPEMLRLTLRGPAPTGSVENTRMLAALIGKVTGLPRDSVQFKVAGPSQWAAVVPVTSEHLRRAAEHWATTLRTAAFPER
jgi:hypothetical protein